MTAAVLVSHAERVTQLDAHSVRSLRGQGRVYVSRAVRQLILDAYQSAGWRSSRAAAEVARDAGYTLSHQTIENFLAGRWTTAEKETLRALLALHDIDLVEVEHLMTRPALGDIWNIEIPERFWGMSAEDRARVERALLVLLDATPHNAE